jgi:hypothetical protein
MPLKLGAGFQDTSPWLLLFSPLPLPYFEKAIYWAIILDERLAPD